MTTKSKVVDHFFLFLPTDSFYVELNAAVATVPEYLRTTGEAFRNNLRAVFAVLTTPPIMAQAKIHSIRYELLALSHTFRIIADTYGPTSEEEVRGEAGRRAASQIEAESATEEGTKSGVESIVRELESALLNEQLSLAAEELLRQGVVLMWSALEVLIGDIFIAVLNRKPALANLLAADERTKKWFQLRDPFRALETYSYDLSSHMGDVLSANHRIDDVDTFRAVADVLFKNESLNRLLQDERLWHLNQKRNLILHRRAVVDDVYIRNTGEALARGVILAVHPRYVDKSLAYARDVGIAFLACAATH